MSHEHVHMRGVSPALLHPVIHSRATDLFSLSDSQLHIIEICGLDGRKQQIRINKKLWTNTTRKSNGWDRGMDGKLFLLTFYLTI